MKMTKNEVEFVKEVKSLGNVYSYKKGEYRGNIEIKVVWDVMPLPKDIEQFPVVMGDLQVVLADVVAEINVLIKKYNVRAELASYGAGIQPSETLGLDCVIDILR